MSADNSQFASAGGDRQVPLWDVSTGKVIRKFKGHDASVHAVAHGADGAVVVTGGGDQCVRVWDLKSRSVEPVQTMRAFKVCVCV